MKKGKFSMTLLGCLAKHMPPPDRRIEVGIQILLFLGLVGGGVVLQLQDHRIFLEYKELQNQMLKIIEARSQTGISGELMSYITSCMNDSEKFKLAMNLLNMTASKVSASDQMNVVTSALVKNCSDFLKSAGLNPGKMVEQQLLSSNQENFLESVNMRLQYYYDGYPAVAAKNWYRAMALLPQSYLEKGSVSIQRLNRARSDYESGEYGKAADRFKSEFEKVVR